MKLLSGFCLLLFINLVNPVFASSLMPDSTRLDIGDSIPHAAFADSVVRPSGIHQTDVKTRLNFYLKALNDKRIGLNPHIKAQTLVDLASLYFKMDSNKAAIRSLLKAQSFYEKTADKAGQASALSLLAAYYERHAMWPQAQENYRKAFSIYTDLKDKEKTTHTAVHLSNVLMQQSKYKEALKYVNYSVNSYQQDGSKDSLAYACLRLSTINFHLKNYRTAEYTALRKALPLFTSADDLFGRSRCFENLGRIYYSQKRYSEAKWFFLQQNTVANTLEDTSAIITSLYYLSRVKVAIGDYSLALEDLRKAETLAKTIGLFRLSSKVKAELAVVYSKLGSARLAKKSAKRSQELEDSMNAVDKDEQSSASLTVEQAIAQNQAELQQKRKIRVIHKKQPAENLSILWLLVPLVLVLVLGIYLFRKKR